MDSDMTSTSHMRYGVGKLDIWLLGITIVMGGQYFNWNAGLAAGVYGYLFSFLLISVAYIIFCCSMAEISGALPFAGGAYGLARCTLGYYAGFLVGCCEALEYITCVATTVMSFGTLIIQMLPSLRGLEPLVWFLAYLVALAVHIRGDHVFWGCNKLLGLASIGFVLLYGFGCLPFVDYHTAVQPFPDQFFAHGSRGPMEMLPYAAWFYAGIENLNLASNDVAEPSKTIPIAQVACILTLFATGLMTFLITICLPMDGGPIAMASELAPLNTGFQRMMKLQPTHATLLSLPGTYAAAFGFMWSYGKLIHSMAQSKLLPAVLASTTAKYQTNYAALLIGSIVGYGICLTVYMHPDASPVVFYLCLLAAFTSYSAQCIGYMALKRHYSKTLSNSTFQSPFRVLGAFVSMVIWILGILSIVAFQPQSRQVVVVSSILLLVLSSFYFVYPRSRQQLSDQERRVLMVAHVAKFNRRNARNRRNLVGGSTLSQRLHEPPSSLSTNLTVFGTSMHLLEHQVKQDAAHAFMHTTKHSRRMLQLKGNKIRPATHTKTVKTVRSSVMTVILPHEDKTIVELH